MLSAANAYIEPIAPPYTSLPSPEEEEDNGEEEAETDEETVEGLSFPKDIPGSTGAKN